VIYTISYKEIIRFNLLMKKILLENKLMAKRKK
jgi:hypothetical protein